MSSGATPSIPPIVSPEWLDADRADLVIADVRWYLDGRSGRAAYEREHIAGAIYIDLDDDLSDHSQPPTAGRHPLPSPERFAAATAALAWVLVERLLPDAGLVERLAAGTAVFALAYTAAYLRQAFSLRNRKDAT